MKYTLGTALTVIDVTAPEPNTKHVSINKSLKIYTLYIISQLLR